MPASSDDQAEQARQARLVQGAFERGRAALGAGDKADAMRWLDRAHRLAPDDGTITLVLASAAIGADNPKAVTLFSQVAADSDVRDAWLGLATARVLLRDLVGASAAVAEALSRHVVWLDIAGLAEQVARSTGAAGWCGLTSGGSVIVHPVGPERIEIRMDGRVVGDAVSVPRSRPARPGDDGRANLPDGAVILPKAWPHGRSVTVIARGPGHEERHLIGSPISLRAIGRVEGHVEAWKGGVRGWAWCPGDPDAAPRLALSAGRARKEIVATDAAPGTSGLAPLALPRSFVIPWTELPERDAPVHLRGRDGRDLPGSPIVASRADRQCRSKHRSEREPPVPQSRRRVQAGWRGDAADAVILVTHNDGGGVEQRIQASVASHAAQGRRAIVLRPTKLPNGSAGVIAVSNSLRDLVFELPREQPALLRLLRGTKPVAAELHHFLNHDPAVFETIRALGVPYDAHTHDYAWFCPRIALVGRGDRYCGEPAQAACETCVAEMGSFLNEDIRIPALLDRSQAILTGARQVIAPSHDAAARLARHFDGISSIVIPHEDDAAIAEPPPIRIEAGAVRVCIAGAIGLHKGFDVLLACARDAKQRALDLTFVVAGTTIDDQRLIDTGRVFVTGPYRPDEAVALIRAQKAALALLPSIWPETWCLGLTELWRAGLRVAAFDIGAPAERIRRTGRGFLLPLNLAPAAINDTLLKWARGRSSLPIRRSSAYKPTH
jgi:glycosyltransferase involved in cell wall biosynthesis